MINTESRHLLFVEPTAAPAATPIIDRLTRLAAGALVASTPGRDRYRGIHRCTAPGCTAMSDNTDHHVAGLMTNSLAVHYLAYHRDAVTPRDLDLVDALNIDEVEPTSAQLTGMMPVQERRADNYR